MRLTDLKETATSGGSSAGGIAGFATTLGQMKGRSVYGDEQFEEAVETSVDPEQVKAALDQAVSQMTAMEFHTLFEGVLTVIENEGNADFEAELGRYLASMAKSRLK